MPGMSLEAFMKKRVSLVFAVRVAEAMKEVCGIQAPVIIVGGKKVAATRATPGAPPRRVTSRLWNSIRVYENKIQIHAPYARFLEAKNHKFVQRSVKLALARYKTGKGGNIKRTR